MKVIIVGCGRLGSELAYGLFKRGHEVSVLDNVAASFNNLPPDFLGRLHEGDALNSDVLKRAGIETADALAAVTNSDALNIVVGHLARKEFNVERVVARNYNPQLRELFEAFNLQVVSSTSWGAQRVEEMIYNSDVRTVFSAGNGEVEIYEIIIPKGCANRTLRDLVGDCEAIVLSVTRGGRAKLPDLDAAMEEGDVIHLSATFDGMELLRKRMCISG
jgi:trk system potassium uptake protein